MATEIVNLNKFKKIHKRVIKERQANINRIKFGQTKVEKVHNKYKLQLQDEELMGKQLKDNGPDNSEIS